MKNCNDGSLLNFFDLLYDLKYGLAFLEGHAFVFLSV